MLHLYLSGMYLNSKDMFLSKLSSLSISKYSLNFSFIKEYELLFVSFVLSKSFLKLSIMLFLYSSRIKISLAGLIRTSSVVAIVFCVSLSNILIESISSEKNSILNGISDIESKISTIEPLRANSPLLEAILALL